MNALTTNTPKFYPYRDALCARKETPGTGPIYIKIEDLGDGVEKAVAIMLFANAYNPRIILWDDFETTAHPTLIRMLLNWLKGTMAGDFVHS